MYPAWATDEYASSLTMLVWASAITLPISIVNAARNPNAGAQASARPAKAMNVTWSSPANPAALEATDRNAATGTGEPS
jgi:hypothetical protein